MYVCVHACVCALHCTNFELHIKVLRRESYGMSCDAWSIGCCVILIATGRPPWAVDKLEDPNIDIVRVSIVIVINKFKCLISLWCVTGCKGHCTAYHTVLPARGNC